MSSKILIGLCVLAVGAVAGKYAYQMVKSDNPVAEVQPSEPDRQAQLVFVGDSEDRVYQMLGQPTIEFPEGDSTIQWYAGYEITIQSNVVMAVRLKPVESEEERLERERRAQMAESRLRSSYQTVADNEQISYDAWREREEVRLQKEREERASFEAYEDRRSSEKKAAIYADAYRRSCGCWSHHRCRH